MDRYGHAAALHLTRKPIDPETGKLAETGDPVMLPARSILVAAGTQPNTVLGREDPENVFLDGRWFQAVDEEGQPVQPEKIAKPKIARAGELASAVAYRMEQHGIMAMPVVDDDNGLVGVVHLHDLLRARVV